MLFGYLFIAVGLSWVICESIIASVKRANRKSSDIADRHSEMILNFFTYSSLIAGFAVAQSKYLRFAKQGDIITWAGLVIVLIGIAIRLHAIYRLKKFFTVNIAILNDHELMTTGIYRFIRHPAYLGVIIAFAGMGLALGNLLSCLIMVTPVLLVFLWRIRLEEQMLSHAFPHEYPAYQKKSWRLIPFII